MVKLSKRKFFRSPQSGCVSLVTPDANFHHDVVCAVCSRSIAANFKAIMEMGMWLVDKSDALEKLVCRRCHPRSERFIKDVNNPQIEGLHDSKIIFACAFACRCQIVIVARSNATDHISECPS